MQKQFVIILGGKEVYKSSSLQDAQKEFSKNKYLLGFTTVRTALANDKSDERIQSYIDETEVEDRQPSKLTKVLIERVHTNKAKKLRSQLISRYHVPDKVTGS